MFLRKKYKTIDKDIFLKRINSTVIGEGMLHDGNIYLIDYAIKNMPSDGFVFEIGSYAGLSTNVIMHLLNKYNKEHIFIGCDAWVYEGVNDLKGNISKHIDGCKHISRTDYETYIKTAFINSINLLQPKNKPYTCHLTSNDFFNNWNSINHFTDVFNRTFSINQGISFCYIDGNHSYEQTKKDFENVDSKLKHNGFILFDDSAKHLKLGSSEFIKEIKQNTNYKIVDANPNYLVQKIKP